MDNCIICLESNDDVFSRITTQSSEWLEGKLQRIIEKHLWWWYIKPPSPNIGIDQWICRQCWQEISTFHTFYCKVENVHRQYRPLLASLEQSNYVEGLCDNIIKNEIENTVEFMMPNDRRNIRSRKQQKTIENIEHKNICMIEVKSEVCFDIHECNDKQKTSEITENIEINELTAIAIKDEHLIGDTGTIEQSYKDELVINEISYCGDSDSVDNIWEPFSNLDQNGGKEYKKTTKAKKEKCKRVSNKARKSQRENAIVPKKLKTEAKNVNSLAKLEISRKNDEYLADSGYKLFCHICNISLKDFLKLKTHYRLEHKIPGYAMCCNKKFYKRGPLADHLRVHENPNYFKCTLCGRILAHRRSYENHLIFHKESNEKRERIFSCEKCDKSFFKKAIYDRHILSHVPDEERKHKCDECDKKFAAEYLVTQHKAVAHLNKYEKICDICGKSFRERLSFMRHMDEHSGAPPAKVPCDICGFESTSKYLLNRHKKNMHTKENQQEQICPYCSKVSPNMHAHRQHINYAHTMERKHACNICEKKFKRAGELKEHLSTHTGEALYSCPYCPRTFISSGNMSKHRRAEHAKEFHEDKLKKDAVKNLRQQKISIPERRIKKYIDTPNVEVSDLESSQDYSLLTELKEPN